ncbi:hypothetical protein CRM22_010097 [Opisthorchis felineus]|uniref:Uncharacterized protein n=1 Tax=Opisthorchis felineus TaxID=147828 RepID=A0A4S2L2D8_OPIFE|nr:hypothetical protein CRM22_010097 [Opisthorchis felineus]TGZ56865.1 hypothetical protein CRM22_010097 [Opisthorchis felineus]
MIHPSHSQPQQFMKVGLGVCLHQVVKRLHSQGVCGGIITKGIEACGEDPHEDNKFVVTVVEMCRDQCDKEERTRCIEENRQNEAEIRNCWKAALNRCIVRCGDDADCLKMCDDIHTPPTLISYMTII